MYSVQTTVKFEYKYEKKHFILARDKKEKHNLPGTQYCV